MPSNSLAALPPTASPTALFAHAALPQQILTPLFSFTSTLLPRSLRGCLTLSCPERTQRGVRKLHVLSHSFALFQKSENHLSCFQYLAHSLQKMPGVPSFAFPDFHFPLSIF